MLQAIKHGLGNLTNINGRDARQPFWLYVLFLYLVSMAISMVVTMPMMGNVMATAVQQGMAQAGNADPAAADAAARAAITVAVGDMLPTIIWTSVATALLLILGLSAALARRLHDSGLSGYWALLPVGLQAFSTAMVPVQMAKVQESMAAAMSGDPTQSLAAIQNSFGPGPLAAWAAIAVVIALGVRKSDEGSNRYGEVPFQID